MLIPCDVLCTAYQPFITCAGVAATLSDGTIAGATVGADGKVSFDISVQTKTAFEALRLELETAGANLSHVVDITCFLIDMSHYAGMSHAVGVRFDLIV